jgi:hypothetical protein
MVETEQDREAKAMAEVNANTRQVRFIPTVGADPAVSYACSVPARERACLPLPCTRICAWSLYVVTQPWRGPQVVAPPETDGSLWSNIKTMHHAPCLRECLMYGAGIGLGFGFLEFLTGG